MSVESSWGTSPIIASDCPVVGGDVFAVDLNRARRRIDDAADDADQRRFAGAVGAEQGENLALLYFKIDVLKSRKAGGVSFGKIGDTE